MGLTSWPRAAKVGATLGGVVVAGATAGLAAQFAADRARERRRSRRGEEVELGTLRSTPQLVRADDGVLLSVEVDEPEPNARYANTQNPNAKGTDAKGTDAKGTDAKGIELPTVVFVHGWVLDMDSWHYQRASLRGTARLVFYDQRSHGRSERSPARHCTLEQLGRDLKSVLDAVVPRGPVVLVGHSMGGMSIMSLAAQFGELVEARVAGVVLCGTSGGDLLAFHRPLAQLQPVLRGISTLISAGRKLNIYPITRRLTVGPDAEEKFADMADELLSRTNTNVLADFYLGIVNTNLYHALEALPGNRTVVIGGTKDAITPFSHSERLAELIDGSTLVACEGAGHMMMLEEHELVSRTILDLVGRAG